jgi:type IV secretion system protein VirB10
MINKTKPRTKKIKNFSKFLNLRKICALLKCGLFKLKQHILNKKIIPKENNFLYLKQISSLNSESSGNSENVDSKALGASSDQRKLIGVIILLFLIFIIFFLIWNPFSSSNLNSNSKNKLKLGSQNNLRSKNNMAPMDNILLQNIRKLEKLQMQAREVLPGFSRNLNHQKDTRSQARLNAKLNARLNAPTSVYDAASSLNKTNYKNISHKLDQKSEQKASFSKIRYPRETIAQGTIIFANLESAINSEIAGMLRAVISNPVYAYKGDKVLIPKGSRLIGKYTSSLANGSASNRLFIIWSRIITPNGLSINIDSNATDALGRAGLGADEVNHHFWQIFGTSSLLSVIGAGAASFDVSSNTQPNSANQYQQAIASSLQQSAGSTLSSNLKTKPTLLIKQGSAVRVFVAHDLDLRGVLGYA